MAPVLGYWNIRGFVAPVRYLMEHVGHEYEWKGYDFDKAQEWKDKKEHLGLEFPNLPYCIDGDLKITQSMAIMRYLGRKYGLIAKSEQDQLEQEMIDGVIWDLAAKWGWLCYVSPDLEEAKQPYRTEGIIPIFKHLDQHLRNKDYIVGNYLTYSDFFLFERVECNVYMFPDILDGFPNLRKHHGRINNLKGVKEFMNSDRFLNVINGANAKWNNV